MEPGHLEAEVTIGKLNSWVHKSPGINQISAHLIEAGSKTPPPEICNLLTCNQLHKKKTVQHSFHKVNSTRRVDDRESSVWSSTY